MLQELRVALPAERFIYLGDTARVPYGTKSPSTVARYAKNVAGLLLDRGCKALVIACNTASAFGLDAVRSLTPVPVLDVIAPVAAAVAETSAGGRIGVLGTRGTVSSGAYLDALSASGRALHVVQRACPLLVPLAEEGWTQGAIPAQVVDAYVGELFRCERLDSLILGCTHYPLLRDEIALSASRHSPTHIETHDSGTHTAESLVMALRARSGLGVSGPGGVTFLVTDDPEKFRQVGARFFGAAVASAEHVVVG